MQPTCCDGRAHARWTQSAVAIEDLISGCKAAVATIVIVTARGRHSSTWKRWKAGAAGKRSPAPKESLRPEPEGHRGCISGGTRLGPCPRWPGWRRGWMFARHKKAPVGRLKTTRVVPLPRRGRQSALSRIGPAVAVDGGRHSVPFAIISTVNKWVRVVHRVIFFADLGWPYPGRATTTSWALLPRFDYNSSISAK